MMTDAGDDTVEAVRLFVAIDPRAIWRAQICLKAFRRRRYFQVVTFAPNF
jgi:hypothetical protein